jgi:hypothetical protein
MVLIPTPTDSRGILVVYMVALSTDGSEGLSGQKIIHWENQGGTATINQITDIEADYLDGFTTASWTVDATSGNLRILNTGETATTIDWTGTFKLKYKTFTP